MLLPGVLLQALAAIGVIAMGAKYVLATPPIDYHAEITREEDIGGATLKVIGALYKVMGGGFLSLGTMLLLITLFGVWEDLLWAKLTALAGGLLAGGFAVLVPRKVEQATGVRTPWRISAALTATIMLAFFLSVL